MIQLYQYCESWPLAISGALILHLFLSVGLVSLERSESRKPSRKPTHPMRIQTSVDGVEDATKERSPTSSNNTSNETPEKSTENRGLPNQYSGITEKTKPSITTKTSSNKSSKSRDPQQVSSDQKQKKTSKNEPENQRKRERKNTSKTGGQQNERHQEKKETESGVQETKENDYQRILKKVEKKQKESSGDSFGEIKTDDISIDPDEPNKRQIFRQLQITLNDHFSNPGIVRRQQLRENVVFEISVQPDGTVSIKNPVLLSDHPVINQNARETIRRSSPLQEPPETSFTVRIVFTYTP